MAGEIRDRVSDGVAELSAAHGRRPGLATVLVGDDPASAIYVRRKREACQAVGMDSIDHDLAADASEAELLEVLGALNADEAVHGILLQLPLPPQLDPERMIAAIEPLKDVDGLHPLNAGLLAHGGAGMVPCTAAGVIELLRRAGTELRGAEAVLLGRSILVGRPLASLLLGADATVTQCHSRTRDLVAVCREAEVLVAAVGSSRLVTGEMVAEGATVIDVGTNRTEEGLVGDVDFEAVRVKARAITPVPGGVGPMTIAMLLSNTVEAAQRSLADRRAAPLPGAAAQR